ncbi:SpoIIE family protein phosphatase [Mumia zhuanghuii]|uniref:SpoIIE family protein phosphatase n=2 Tax=Mumia TaxID=1546255 RepID=A0ABW1QPW1_9ACTN|nr:MULTISPECIES: ATP-binding SpoIIE family protein phosphatase [Mumia]KAA1422207.1 SpoIIE family protein phosphatase [Mumia zhuanghuii]
MSKHRSYAHLTVLVVLSLALAAGISVTWRVYDLEPGTTLPWACLPVLLVTVAAASHFTVEVRGPRDPFRFTLVTSAIAPLVYGYGVGVVAATVALAHVPSLFSRRVPRMRTWTLMARWTLAATAGTAVADLLGVGAALTDRAIFALLTALVVIVVVNTLWVVIEGAVTDADSWPYPIRSVGHLAVGAAAHLAVNALFGLLFVFALAGSPFGVLLVPVPLLLTFTAARLYEEAYADRARVETLSETVRVLSDPVDPMTAVRPFLKEIRDRFDARAVSLVVHREDARASAYRLSTDDDYEEDVPVGPLERRLARGGEATRASVDDNSAIARLLREGGRTSCLSAPMQIGPRDVGVIVLLDVPEPTTGRRERDQMAVMKTLARQTAHTLTRGWAIAKVVQNERSLAEILQSTSDGIFTVDAAGRIATWNPACEQITGLAAADVVGRRDALQRVQARTATNRPVDLSEWQEIDDFPREMVITATDGRSRQLACSFAGAEGSEGSPLLVVVARDITPATEFHELREQFKHLVAVQAAQRLVVDHLQQAVAPEPPGIDGVDIAVSYVASDPTAPTGGDLFDWHLLPTGELHVAVVDVLGHGVTATRDALTVIHTLRYVAVEGTPLERLIVRADDLLGAQESDLVATVVVARFNPATGDLRVASGGHPPAIVVSPDGAVREVSSSGGAIGWPGVGSSSVASTRLGAGDSLILYTDGLVEARRDIIAGMAQLERIASEVADLPAQKLSDALVLRSLEGAERHDDALALVVRRAARPAAASVVRWELGPQATSMIGRVRRELAQWMSEQEITGDDALLVAGELLSNAIAAARTRAVLSAEVVDGALVLVVSDDGRGDPDLAQQGLTPPPAGTEGGRGLFIVRQLSSDVQTLSTGEGSTVRARVVTTPRTPVSAQ